MTTSAATGAVRDVSRAEGAARERRQAVRGG